MLSGIGVFEEGVNLEIDRLTILIIVSNAECSEILVDFLIID
jgi:hypothetical protein